MRLTRPRRARVIRSPSASEEWGPSRYLRFAGTIITLCLLAAVFVAVAGKGALRTIDVGGWPLGIDVGSESVWVGNWIDRSVVRLDEEGDYIETIEVGSPIGDLRFGFNAVWACTDNSVLRIDPESESSSRISEFKLGGTCVDLALGHDRVWVSAQEGLWEIDPQLMQHYEVADFPGLSTADVAAGTEYIWLLHGEEGEVTRIDPETYETRPVHVGTSIVAAAIGHGFVWLTSPQTNQVIKISERTGAVAEQRIDVGTRPWGLAVDDLFVWVANLGDGSVSKVDPRKNAEVARPRVRSGPDGIVSTGRSIWTANPESGTVSRLRAG